MRGRRPKKKEGRHGAALPTNGAFTPVGRDYSIPGGVGTRGMPISEVGFKVAEEARRTLVLKSGVGIVIVIDRCRTKALC